MPRNATFQFGLPRFQGAVRYIVLLTLGVWLTVILLWAFDKPLAAQLLVLGELNSDAVLHHGWIWQLVTYTFVHIDPRHVIFALIGVFFIGSSVQERVGSKSFTELYLFSAVVAGILGLLLSLTGRIGSGTAFGAGAAVNGVLMVFYLLNRGTSIFLIPFPFQIPVQWVVIVIGGIEAAYFVLSGFSLFFLVQLLGLGSGFLWYRWMWKQTNVFAFFGNQLGSFRNSYHRWKRRRAGKKFQVYMRKHNQDPADYFDEYGNFRPPDEKDKKNGGSKGGWVN
jgi:membrane associated rhomboid family serine protease